MSFGFSPQVIDSVPYRSVRPEYTVPASNPVRSTPLFRTGKNTGRTGIIPAISNHTGRTGKNLYCVSFFS